MLLAVVTEFGGPKMYVCYLFEFGRPTERRSINCDSDTAARRAAEALLTGSRVKAVEVWDGIRLVYHTGGRCPESGPINWEPASAIRVLAV
jgi:hypothetical protein